MVRNTRPSSAVRKKTDPRHFNLRGLKKKKKKASESFQLFFHACVKRNDGILASPWLL